MTLAMTLEEVWIIDKPASFRTSVYIIWKILSGDFTINGSSFYKLVPLNLFVRVK